MNETPTILTDQQAGLATKANLQAGQAGSPWSPIPAAPVPVKINPTTQIDSGQLMQTPKTTFDIQSLLQENQTKYQDFISQQSKFQDQYLKALAPDDNITNLQKQLNDLRNEARNTSLSAQAGIQRTGQKVIPMQSIVGQQENIAQQANLKLQTLAAQQAPLVDQLTLAQQSKQQLLQGLEAMMSFGRENYTTGQEMMQFTLGLQKYQKELEQIQKQEEAAAKQFALEQQVNMPFYTVDGKTIYRTADGKAYSNEQEWIADGGRPELIQRNLKTPDQRAFERDVFESDRDYGLQKDKFAFDKEQANKKSYQLSEDADGNPIIFDPETGTASTVDLSAISTKYTDGSYGGQCGDFAHRLADFPPVGNMLSEKQAAVNKNGISADQWRQEGAQPGDVLITSENTTYGHVAVVIKDNGDGTVTVKDSNYGMDEKIRTRTVDMANGKIYGVIRAKLKPGLTTPAKSAIKLTPDQTQRLTAEGLDKDTINNVLNDIASAGIDEALGEGSGLSDTQRRAFYEEMRGQTAANEAMDKTIRIDDGWVANKFDYEAIIKAGKMAKQLLDEKGNETKGPVAKFFSGYPSNEELYKAGLEAILKKAQNLRSQGKTADEIRNSF